MMCSQVVRVTIILIVMKELMLLPILTLVRIRLTLTVKFCNRNRRRKEMAIDHRIFSRLFSILIILILALTLNAKQIQIATATVDIFGSQSLEPDSIESQVIRCIIPLCTGTNKDDIIIGSFLNETIFGLKGDDNIQGN